MTPEEILAEINKRLDELYEQLPDARDVEDGNYTKEQALVLGKYEALEQLADLIDKTIDISCAPQDMTVMDLEKLTDKIKTFQERYEYPVIPAIKGAMAVMARMFYQYPNVARQWYDRLSKTTID